MKQQQTYCRERKPARRCSESSGSRESKHSGHQPKNCPKDQQAQNNRNEIRRLIKGGLSLIGSLKQKKQSQSHQLLPFSNRPLSLRRPIQFELGNQKTKTAVCAGDCRRRKR